MLSGMQFASSILDALIAPEFSEVTSCDAPEIESLPDYSTKYFLNNLLVATSADDARPAIVVFLRHLRLAFDHYRHGRLELLECVQAEQHSARAVAIYLRALSQFENAVLRTHLAVTFCRAVARLYDEGALKKPYDKKLRTKEARLNALANRLKHFDSDIVERLAGNRPNPLWITNGGLRCLLGGRRIDLSFVELSELLEELRQDAHWLADESYTEARKRHAARKIIPERSRESQ